MDFIFNSCYNSIDFFKDDDQVVIAEDGGNQQHIDSNKSVELERSVLLN